MEQVLFAIRSIKETEYYVNESLQLDNEIDFHYNASIENRVDVDEVHFTITVNYRRKGTTEDYLRGKTISVFTIQNMKSRISKIDDKESLDLPEPLWVTLFSVSFTHARAMLARSAAGTKYNHLIMPLINPEAEFKKLFGAHLHKK